MKNSIEVIKIVPPLSSLKMFLFPKKIISNLVFFLLFVHNTNAQFESPLLVKKKDFLYDFSKEGTADFLHFIARFEYKRKEKLINELADSTSIFKQNLRSFYLARRYMQGYTLPSKNCTSQKEVKTNYFKRYRIEKDLYYAYLKRKVGKSDLAIKTLNSLIPKINTLESVELKFCILNELGASYIQVGNNEQAKVHFNRALSIISADVCEPSMYKLILHSKLSRLNFALKDTLNCQRHCKIIVALSDTLHKEILNSNEHFILNVLYNIKANALRFLNDSESANRIALLNAPLCMKIGNLKGAQRLYKQMDGYYFENGQIDSAYYYLKLSDSILQIIEKNKSLKELAKLESDFNAQDLKKEGIIREGKQKNETLFSLLITSILLFIISILILLILHQRRKRKTELLREELKHKKSKLKIQKSEFELEKLSTAVNVKDNIIVNLTEQLESSLKNSEDKLKIINELKNSMILTVVDVDKYIHQFNVVHPGYIDFIQLSFNPLANNDKLIIAMTTIGLTNKLQAKMLGVSPKSLTMARYRLNNKQKKSSGLALSKYLKQKELEFKSI